MVAEWEMSSPRRAPRKRFDVTRGLGIPRPNDDDLWSDLIQPVPHDKASSLPPLAPLGAERGAAWSAQSARGPLPAAPLTVGRPLFTERRVLQSKNHHPWVARYVRPQGTWHRTLSLMEYTRSEQLAIEAEREREALLRAAERERRRVLQSMRADKRSALSTPRRDSGADTGAEMTQNDWEHLVADKLRQKSKAAVRKVFVAADEDASGMLDIYEFVNSLGHLGAAEVPRSIAMQMFTQLDTESSGMMPIDELVNKLLQPKGVKLSVDQKKKMATLQWQDPKALFEKWDGDGSGSLSGIELREGLKSYGLPPDLADSIAFALDQDGDGKITQQEWQSEFYKSPLVMQKQPLLEDFRDLNHKQLGCMIYQVEMRGITIFQLTDLYSHVERRCEKEAWKNYLQLPLHPYSVNTYDVARYVIRPATYSRQVSYVEYVAVGPQKPRWFVSHWWGEAIQTFIACLNGHCYDRALSRQFSPYWICAYANNQWTLASSVGTEDPAQSAFHRAISITEGMVAIVDVSAQLFKRVWCAYEAHLAFSAQHHYPYDVYTLPDTAMARRKMRAVGLTDGQTPNDGPGDLGAKRKAQRERDFPIEVAERLLNPRIETAAASVESDRVHILNSLIGEKNLNEKLRPNGTPEYGRLNGKISAHYVVNVLPAAICKQTEGPFLEALKMGRIQHLVEDFDGQEAFDSTVARQLGVCLPQQLESITLSLNGCGDAFLVGCNLERLKTLESLILPSNGISDDGVAVLCAAFIGKKLDNLVKLDLSSNMIRDKPMLRLYEATHKLEMLTEIKVDENPAMGYISEAVQQKQINSAAREFQQHLNGTSGSLARLASERN